MSPSPPVLRVAAAVFVREDRVLAARRGPGQSLAGLWEFPGGKLEPGESPEECLVREIREELGLDARLGAHLLTGRVDHGERTLELLAYGGELLGEVRGSTDHDELRWVPLPEVMAIEWAPADVPVALLIRDRWCLAADDEEEARARLRALPDSTGERPPGPGDPGSEVLAVTPGRAPRGPTYLLRPAGHRAALERLEPGRARTLLAPIPPGGGLP